LTVFAFTYAIDVDISSVFDGRALAEGEPGTGCPVVAPYSSAAVRCPVKYPDSYCIKCKKHTDTLGKHTIMLVNNRRALKGICPICATETYRFMPKKDDARATPPLSVISSMKKLEKNAPVSAVLPTSTAKRLDRYGRPSPAQELLYYGSLLVVLGLGLAVGFVAIMRMM
jgi:hypothetical protein